MRRVGAIAVALWRGAANETRTHFAPTSSRLPPTLRASARRGGAASSQAATVHNPDVAIIVFFRVLIITKAARTGAMIKPRIHNSACHGKPKRRSSQKR
jgi:hypothetical protein